MGMADQTCFVPARPACLVNFKGKINAIAMGNKGTSTAIANKLYCTPDTRIRRQSTCTDA